MENDKLDILFLCNYKPFEAATVSDHINAFYEYSQHRIFIYSHLTTNRGNLPKDLELGRFDCIIVHYSLFLAIEAYISPSTKERIKKFNGLKVIFIQDEYRFVNSTIKYLKELKFNILFTCVPEPEIEKVYPGSLLPNLKKINVLTGYVPNHLNILPTKPLHKRKYHVGYRGRKYPYWHGCSGLEKWEIAKKFEKDAKDFKIKTNISWLEKNRLYGKDWINFMMNCKAVLGVESGCSVFDFTGKISSATETYVGLFKEDSITYEEARDKYFKDHENLIRLEQISPRCFEAIAVRTMLILYEGSYSNILKPWLHYVPLKKDHSNMHEVVSVIRDDKKIAEIITRAFSEIACNEEFAFSTFIRYIDRIISNSITEGMLSQEEGYSDNEFYGKWEFCHVPNPHELISSKYEDWIDRQLKRFTQRMIPIVKIILLPIIKLWRLRPKLKQKIGH